MGMSSGSSSTFGAEEELPETCYQPVALAPVCYFNVQRLRKTNECEKTL